MKKEHHHNEDENAEALALLRYMAQHNAHHAQELKDIESLLSADAAELISAAVELLDASTEKIKEAIKKTED